MSMYFFAPNFNNYLGRGLSPKARAGSRGSNYTGARDIVKSARAESVTPSPTKSGVRGVDNSYGGSGPFGGSEFWKSKELFRESPDFMAASRKKKKPKARLPNLDPMLAEGKSRKHLEIFLMMRGVSILEVEDAIDHLITRYNEKYPWKEYKERVTSQAQVPLGGSGPRTSDARVNTSQDPYPEGYYKGGSAGQLEKMKLEREDKNQEFSAVIEFGATSGGSDAGSGAAVGRSGDSVGGGPPLKGRAKARAKAQAMYKQQREYISKKAKGYKTGGQYEQALVKAQAEHEQYVEV